MPLFPGHAISNTAREITKEIPKLLTLGALYIRIICNLGAKDEAPSLQKILQACR